MSFATSGVFKACRAFLQQRETTANAASSKSASDLSDLLHARSNPTTGIRKKTPVSPAHNLQKQVNVESEIVDESMDKPKARRAGNYSVAEDLILIAAWEHTSEHVFTGINQAKEQYWTRVWREYLSNASNYPNRPKKSIINRFSIIRTKCLKFSGIVQSIEYANPSGMTELDKLNQAIQAWSTEEKERGVFKLFHCYQMLKNSPKWIVEVVRPNLGQNQAASDLINLGDSGESQTNINFEMSQDLLRKFCDQKMDVICEASKKMDEYLQLKREKLELDWEYREEKVMTIDMSNLNEMQRKYIEMKQTKIFEKVFNK